MKKLIQSLFIISISLVFTFCTLTAFADSTPPNPPQQEHGGAGDLPPGGGAPVGNGIYILVTLGITYTLLKFRRMHISKISAILLLFTLIISQTTIIASNIPPNPPSGSHGGTGDQPPGGGGAPLGDGVFILILASAGYGSIKYYSQKSTLELEE